MSHFTPITETKKTVTDVDKEVEALGKYLLKWNYITPGSAIASL